MYAVDPNPMIVRAPEGFLLPLEDLHKTQEVLFKSRGNPAPTIQWFKDDRLIDEDDPQIKSTSTEYESSSILSVALSPASAGDYTIKVSNEHGEITKNMKLAGKYLI